MCRFVDTGRWIVTGLRRPVVMLPLLAWGLLTPLVYWLAKTSRPEAELVSLVIDLPIVVPPAVVGIALLATFGRRGLLGPALAAFGVHLPFSTAAVVLAQIVVSAPFYVQSAATAFRSISASSKPGRCHGSHRIRRRYRRLNSSSFTRPLALAASAIAQSGCR